MLATNRVASVCPPRDADGGLFAACNWSAAARSSHLSKDWPTSRAGGFVPACRPRRSAEAAKEEKCREQSCCSINRRRLQAEKLFLAPRAETPSAVIDQGSQSQGARSERPVG